MRALITGGSGYLGQALARRLLQDGASRVVLFSRSESRQAEVAERLQMFEAARFFLGDVRDQARLEEAMWGCDVVVHTAALKRIDAIAYDPGEVRKTNIVGSSCVVAAAIATGIRKVLMISSDKAVSPQNAYGISKAQMEHEATASNAIAFPRGTKISCTRWGNVLGSTGSVVTVWRRQLTEGLPLTLTDPLMTRFILSAGEAVGFTLAALETMEGGETFIPMLPAATVGDLAEAVAGPTYPREIIGLRPGGEKPHEALLSPEEVGRTWWDGTHRRMVVLPSLHSWRKGWATDGMAPVERAYTSDAPARWLTVPELVNMLKEVPG